MVALYYNMDSTVLMFNSYLPHEFKVDSGIDAFRFIHFNIKATPK